MCGCGDSFLSAACSPFRRRRWRGSDRASFPTSPRSGVDEQGGALGKSALGVYGWAAAGNVEREAGGLREAAGKDARPYCLSSLWPRLFRRRGIRLFVRRPLEGARPAQVQALRAREKPTLLRPAPQPDGAGSDRLAVVAGKLGAGRPTQSTAPGRRSRRLGTVRPPQRKLKASSCDEKTPPKQGFPTDRGAEI